MNAHFVIISVLMASVQAVAAEIKMSCTDGTYYRYSKNLLSDGKVVLRKDASWIDICDAFFSEGCSVTVSDKGAKMTAHKNFTYRDANYKNPNLKKGVEYRVTETTFIDFVIRLKRSQLAFESITENVEHAYVQDFF